MQTIMLQLLKTNRRTRIIGKQLFSQIWLGSSLIFVARYLGIKETVKNRHDIFSSLDFNTIFIAKLQPIKKFSFEGKEEKTKDEPNFAMTCLSTTKFSFLRYPACLRRGKFGHKDDKHRYLNKKSRFTGTFSSGLLIILLIGSFRDQHLLKGQSSMPQ